MGGPDVEQVAIRATLNRAGRRIGLDTLRRSRFSPTIPHRCLSESPC